MEVQKIVQHLNPRRVLLALAFALALLLLLSGCEEVRQPDYVQVVVLTGTAYERGFQHGQQLAPRIRSLYAKLLPNSLMPYLNREQGDVADVLINYKDDPDDERDSHYEVWHRDCMATCESRCSEKCGFSYLLMLESGREMEKSIPEEYLEEMRGIADGADMPYEEILILNTFLDTMLAFRSITFFIRQIQAPFIRSVEFVGADKDGRDNNGDGQKDEKNEGRIRGYEPSPHALMVELAPDTTVRLVLRDQRIPLNKNPEDILGVDPETIRIQLNETVYTAVDHPEVVQTEVLDEASGDVEVRFTPPGGFPEAAVSSLVIQAGDRSRSVARPIAAKFMRDERITFTTAGYGKPPHEVPNRGMDDGRTQPPSIGFAVRGKATRHGDVLHAHHYALLDSNTTHKHTVLFVHEPEDGEAHAVLGYSGVVWGFSGMNKKGVTVSFNNSDTLDNAMVGRVKADFIEAYLLAEGVPVGIAGREVLRRASRVQDGVDYLGGIQHTFGWNFLLADAEGDMAALEVDAGGFSSQGGSVKTYRPDPGNPDHLDAWGRPYASTSPDDLRMASHYAAKLDDVPVGSMVMIFEVAPQRGWTSFYYRSLRAFYNLGDAIETHHGSIDVASAIEILRRPELVDTRDSMTAVVFEPQKGILHVAMGGVPATDEPFVAFDLAQALGKEASR